MFERFTRGARDVIVRAQVEARYLGDGQIGTEHLLLGVLASTGAAASALEESGLDLSVVRATVPVIARKTSFTGEPDPDALATIGIDIDEIRRSVEEAFGPGALESTKAAKARAGRRPRRHIPFSAHAKQALEYALREALALKHREIGPEHLLLGALRNSEATASAVLREAGADPAEVRRALLARMAA
jgi:ATP-dependent Clp protease ATP-binding subunit ClpA